MRRTARALFVCAGVIALACNAVLGLEEKQLAPNDSASGANAGMAGGSESAAGENVGGDVGTSAGDCIPDDERTCRAVYPTLLGNCSDGIVRCDRNGVWGPCSVEPENADSCDDEGDDADCDGTPNGGCPCLSGDTQTCGPDTDAGTCEFGTSICVNELWGACQGAVLPGERDCQSSDDNDCDGMPDDTRDDQCPCASAGTHQCVAEAPADWLGPMALATAAAPSTAPSCNATGYERQVLSLFGAIDEGEAACGCTCSPPANMTCGTSVGIYHSSSTTANCNLLAPTGATPDYTRTMNQCSSVVVPTGKYKPVAPDVQGGACTPVPTEDIEAAGFTTRMVACETTDSDPAGCDAAELCVPELGSPLETFCIYRVGTHDCSSGPYSERTIYHDDFSDDRSCTPCTCGALTGTCTGTISFHEGATCPHTLISRFAIESYGDCVVVDSSHTSPTMSASSATPEGACAPSGGTLDGSVSLDGAVTVCCMP